MISVEKTNPASFCAGKTELLCIFLAGSWIINVSEWSISLLEYLPGYPRNQPLSCTRNRQVCIWLQIVISYTGQDHLPHRFCIYFEILLPSLIVFIRIQPVFKIEFWEHVRRTTKREIKFPDAGLVLLNAGLDFCVYRLVCGAGLAVTSNRRGLFLQHMDARKLLL